MFITNRKRKRHPEICFLIVFSSSDHLIGIPCWPSRSELRASSLRGHGAARAHSFHRPGVSDRLRLGFSACDVCRASSLRDFSFPGTSNQLDIDRSFLWAPRVFLVSSAINGLRNAVNLQAGVSPSRSVSYTHLTLPTTPNV